MAGLVRALSPSGGTAKRLDHPFDSPTISVCATLLVHRSDIHIHGTSDPILGRSAAIVDAIKNFEREGDMAVIAITGDLAN